MPAIKSMYCPVPQDHKPCGELKGHWYVGKSYGAPHPTTRFTVSPRGKLECTICGVSGWPGGSWKLKHDQRHQHTCEYLECLRAYTSAQGLAGHMRTQHPKGIG